MREINGSSGHRSIFTTSLPPARGGDATKGHPSERSISLAAQSRSLGHNVTFRDDTPRQSRLIASVKKHSPLDSSLAQAFYLVSQHVFSLFFLLQSVYVSSSFSGTADVALRAKANLRHSCSCDCKCLQVFNTLCVLFVECFELVTRYTV